MRQRGSACNDAYLNVQLWDGGPLGVVLDGITQPWVVELVQNIHHLKVCLAGVEERENLVTETTLRLLTRALNEHYDLVVLDNSLNHLLHRYIDSLASSKFDLLLGGTLY